MYTHICAGWARTHTHDRSAVLHGEVEAGVGRRATGGSGSGGRRRRWSAMALCLEGSDGGEGGTGSGSSLLSAAAEEERIVGLMRAELAYVGLARTHKLTRAQTRK
jgi:hypothetical protein